MNTKYTFMLKKIEKISLLCLLTWFYNNPSMARTTPVSNKIFIIPKVFEPLEFDCIYWYKLTINSKLFLNLCGPSCSKLMTSLVNDMLKFQLLLSQIHQYFLLKKCEKLLQCKSFSHFFNKKFQCIWLLSGKTLNELTS